MSRWRFILPMSALYSHHPGRCSSLELYCTLVLSDELIVPYDGKRTTQLAYTSVTFRYSDLLALKNEMRARFVLVLCSGACGEHASVFMCDEQDEKGCVGT